MNCNSLNQPRIFSFRPPKAANTLFLDRDGVLNQAVLRSFEVSSPRIMEELKIREDIDALADSEIVANWNLVVVSNQPDISRGRIDMAFLKAVHAEINCRIPLNAIYICSHQQSDNCFCRKPKTGLIQQFRKDNLRIKGKECMVGDCIKDRDCALNAGIPFVLLKRPYNSDLDPLTQFVLDDLWELKYILQKII